MSRLDEKRFRALGQEWICRFDFNATCAIEEETGKGFYEFVAPMLIQLDAEDAKNPAKVMQAITGLRQSNIRLVLFHALSGAHEVTLEQVGDIIHDIGTAEAMGIIAWAIAQAMPGAGADDGEEEGNVPPAPNRKARRAAAKRG
jgi:hypothetical protein